MFFNRGDRRGRQIGKESRDGRFDVGVNVCVCVCVQVI